MKQKLGGRPRLLVPCGWCGREQLVSKLMRHLRECEDRPVQREVKPVPWNIKAEGKWQYLVDKIEDKIRMIPDLRGRYSMRAVKDDLLDTAWEIEDFVEEYSRQVCEEIKLSALSVKCNRGGERE